MLNQHFMKSETLAEYVSRVMREKNLSTLKIARDSRGGIGQSHVHRIANGVVTSPSTDKLLGLARGLAVPSHELFAVARGVAPGKVLANERLAAIDAVYSSIGKVQRQKCDFLIEVLEREILRLAAEEDSRHQIDDARVVKIPAIGEMTDETAPRKRKQA